MKKIILIEDRQKRQELFIQESGFKFEKYSHILDNITISEDCDETVKNLIDDFDFSIYDVVICHKSVECKSIDKSNESIINKITNYCKDNQKTLVLFSGGIDANYNVKEGDYEYLEINSKTFYSHNLELFLEDFNIGNINPLILCYGTKWRLNIVLNIFEKINTVIAEATADSILFSRFKKDYEVDLLSSFGIDTPKIEGAKISYDDVKIYRDSLEAYIKESVTYE